MNMEAIMEYGLIQQTPMLHFQHQEQGACIRASEIKPKLDKYIIKKLNLSSKINDNNEYDWIWKKDDKAEISVNDWFISRTKKTDIALNYKLKVFSNGQTEKLEPYSLYYCNMGIKPEKRIKMIRCNVKLKIICFVDGLNEIIRDELAGFFRVHNFGRMQNKGFGSFLIENDTIRDYEIGRCLCDYYEAAKCYKLCYEAEDYKRFINDEKRKEEKAEEKYRKPIAEHKKKSNWPFEQYVFESIKSVYSIMKSGQRNPYVRGIIYKYFYDKYNIRNEKQEMKKEKISPDIKKSTTRIIPESRDPSDIRYVRAMLGVGDKYEYIQKLINDRPAKDERGRIIKERISVFNRQSGSNKKEIERMKSPIFFKIVKKQNQYNVYIIAHRLNEMIYDQPFQFTNHSTGKTILIRTPEKFDIDDFLDYFMDKYNKIDEKHKGNNISMEEIYVNTNHKG